MPFTPIQTLVGGFLLHLSTSSLLSETGRVFGISGIVDNALLGDRASWRWSTLFGLAAGPVLVRLLGLGDLGVDDGLAMWKGLGYGRIGLAGVLVGLGSKLGSGCTSGHFLCGVSRLSPRSLLATATFFSAAVVTANLFPAPTPALLGLSKGYDLALPSQEIVITLCTAVAGVMAAQKALRYLLSAEPTPGPKGQSRDRDESSSLPSRPMRELPYLLHGLTFSLGLIISGMVSPLKVLSFLQPLSPTFDPSLAMVVLAGVIPNGIHYFQSSYVAKKQTKYKWEEWRVPSRTDIDWKLVVGSAVFGVGWGLAGVCPGPALVGVSQALVAGSTAPGTASGVEKVAAWVAAMASGMVLGGML